jgi:drug/metabolite transporter (DMT)-like permease
MQAMDEEYISTNNRFNKGIFYAFITAFMWGFLAIALKVAIRYFDSVTIVWSRFAIAFVILLCFNQFFSRSFSLSSRLPVMGIIAGILLAANYYSFMMGIELTTVNNTQVLIQLGPLFLVVIGIFIFKESLNKIQSIGFGIASIGFFLFYQEQLNMFFHQQASYRIGNYWIMFSGLTWAFFAAIQKVLVRTYHPQQLNLIIYGVSVVLFMHFVDFQQFLTFSLFQWSLLIYLGLNTVIAYGCLGVALKYAEANKVSMIITLNPILTILSFVFLEKIEVTWIDSEHLDYLGYLGALFIILGVVLVVGNKKQQLQKSK